MPITFLSEEPVEHRAFRLAGEEEDHVGGAQAERPAGGEAPRGWLGAVVHQEVAVALIEQAGVAGEERGEVPILAG